MHALLSSADFFSKLTFSNNYIRNIITVSNSLDLDQAQHFVGSDLGSKCLQRSSADDTSKPRDNMSCFWFEFIQLQFQKPKIGTNCTFYGPFFKL